MHLVIFFCGSLDETGFRFVGEEGYHPRDAYLSNNPNVKTMVVKCCNHKEVCDSFWFPNLRKFAKRFCQKLFFSRREDEDATSLSLANADLDSLKIGINQAVSSEFKSGEKIEGITLCGFSRGAVTCFEVARQLNQIAPEIPVNIVADHPVPGNAYQLPGSNAASIADCSDLTNVKKVSIILGAYTGVAPEQPVFPMQRTIPRLVHRGFFSQIIPKLPESAEVNLTLMSMEHHSLTDYNQPGLGQHLHLELAKQLSEQALVDPRFVGLWEQSIQRIYSRERINMDEVPETDRAFWTKVDTGSMWLQHSRKSTPIFPLRKHLQPVFGIKRKSLWQHRDKLYPWSNPLHQRNTLYDWWQKHERYASWKQSDLTKALVEKIREIPGDDSQSRQNLIQLFTLADQWLAKKAYTETSRYEQVHALRELLFKRLMNKFEISQEQLLEINRQNLKACHFYLDTWNKVIASTSFIKTAATKKLEAAVKAHDAGEDTYENDKKLLDAMTEWLEEKKDSKSSRFEVIERFQEILLEQIKKRPEHHRIEELSSLHRSLN